LRVAIGKKDANPIGIKKNIPSRKSKYSNQLLAMWFILLIHKKYPLKQAWLITMAKGLKDFLLVFIT
jgi:hypothetical protein